MSEADGVILDSVRSWSLEKGLRLNADNVSTSPEDQELLSSWQGLANKKKLSVGLREQIEILKQQMIVTATRSWYEKNQCKLERSSKTPGDPGLAQAWRKLLNQPRESLCEAVRVLVNQLDEDMSRSSSKAGEVITLVETWWKENGRRPVQGTSLVDDETRLASRWRQLLLRKTLSDADRARAEALDARMREAAQHVASQPAAIVDDC